MDNNTGSSTIACRCRQGVFSMERGGWEKGERYCEGKIVFKEPLKRHIIYLPPPIFMQKQRTYIQLFFGGEILSMVQSQIF